MSNPHPVKQERYAGDVMTARMKAKFKVYVPRVRLAGEALPNTISCFGNKNVYEPAAVATVRPSADDHLAIPSRSFAGVSYPNSGGSQLCEIVL